MNIRIVIKGVAEPGELREYAEEKISTALDRFADRITSVTVRLEDAPGARRPHAEKQCSIDTRMKSSGEIVIKEHSEDLQSALLTALDRLKAAVSRKAGKMKRGIGRG
jgi:ribosomal subunit interface protein